MASIRSALVLALVASPLVAAGPEAGARSDGSLGVVAELGKPLVAAAVSRNGLRFAVAPSADEVFVFATDSLRQIVRVDTGGVSTRALALSPSGELLLSASGDGRLRVWNLERNRLIVQWPGNSDELGAVAWAPDGQTIAAGGMVHDTAGRRKGAVTLYTPLGLELRSFEPHTKFVTSLAFSPDALRLVVGGPEGVLSVLDPSGAAPPYHLQVDASDSPPQVHEVAFAPDGTKLAAACGDGTVRVWSVPDWKPLVLLPGDAGGHRSGVNGVTFSADGARLASVGADQTLRLWDLRRPEPLAVLDGHLGALTAVATTASGELLTAAEDGAVRRWSWSVPDRAPARGRAPAPGRGTDGFAPGG